MSMKRALTAEPRLYIQGATNALALWTTWIKNVNLLLRWDKRPPHAPSKVSHFPFSDLEFSRLITHYVRVLGESHQDGAMSLLLRQLL